MLSIFKTAAVAVFAMTGVASAATVAGTFNASGMYSVANGTTFDLGEEIDVSNNTSMGQGAFSGISGGATDFSLFTSAMPNTTNAGSTFSFGDFTFTIESTETSSLDNVGLQVFGLGTITGGGFDASAASFRFSAAGVAQNAATSGFSTLFIQAPPEDIPAPAPVPLPAGAPLLVGGLALLGMARRRRAS